MIEDVFQCDEARQLWKRFAGMARLRVEAMLNGCVACEPGDRLDGNICYSDCIIEPASIAHALVNLCESPIEQVMLVALLQQNWGTTTVFDSRFLIEEGAICEDFGWPQRDRCTVLLACQAPEGRYRIDFGIIAYAMTGEALKLAVEVDGHDFHDRTKQQASRDRRRDRALAAAGWRVLRFTGSDVYRDPLACAGEVAAFAATFLMDATERFIAGARSPEGIA